MSSMQILLIEPDRLLAASYEKALRRAGHTVTTAVSAQQAIHFADQQRPDVVVLEMELPRHNGVEFLYEFRSYYEWLDVPVIVHSFVAATELVKSATLKDLGVVKLLYKPATTLAQLCTAIAVASPVTQSI